MSFPRPHHVAAAALLALACPFALGQTPAPDVQTQLAQLAARLAQLEAQNQALARELAALRGTAAIAASTAAPATAPVAPAADPRIAAVEAQQVMLAHQVRTLTQPSAGPTIEGSVIGVAQHLGGAGSETGGGQARLNWRGDVTIDAPLGTVRPLGDAALTLFGHLRAGQGQGVALRPTFTSAVNSVPFEAGAGSSETYAIVAQAWGQFTWALDAARFNDQPGSRIEFTAGKMDLFGFFDQNAVAGDEGAQFLNNIFVHNPLLDSGGDIAADAYGLAPGLRLAWIHETDDASWGLSGGVYASGVGADWNASPSEPLVIAQAEWIPKQINGTPRGGVRLYAWTNGRTQDLAGATQRHSGWGISADHRVGGAWNLFGRLGVRTAGEGAFDRALTLGLEHGGATWGRRADALGVAAGWLRTSSRAMASGPFSGYESVWEAYYRVQLGEHLTLTPDVQYIRRPAGDPTAGGFTAFAVRANASF